MQGTQRSILVYSALTDQPCREMLADDLWIAADLRETAHMAYRCAGLAAPQIGADVCLIVVCPKQELPLLMANPVITQHGRDTETRSEGCLSYPGWSRLIERFRVVTVSFSDPEDLERRRERTFKSLAARVVQHEIDHLDGMCKVALTEDGARR